MINRTPAGIKKEVEDIKKFIAYEEDCLRTGKRTGTYHHPKQRITNMRIALKQLGEQ